MNRRWLAFKKTALILGASWLAFSLYSAFCPYSVVWNRTASIPMGVYLAERVDPSMLAHDDAACFRYVAPSWAKDRHYFPDGFMLCKYVKGLPGDTVTVSGNTVQVHWAGQSQFRPTGTLAAEDSAQRPLPPDALATQVIPSGFLLLVAPAHPNSLDSRYLGLIPAAQVTTRIHPLITW